MKLTDFVFVYGSLKRGFGNHRCLEGAEFIGPGILDNAKMLNLGAFPGLVPATTGEIFGEIYKITPTILVRLDRLEGHPHFYCREIKPIFEGFEQNSPCFEAWVYYLSKDSIAHYSEICETIPSGNWK